MGQPPKLQHAIVIGASIAGLCAARVLSDHFDRVTVYDRDMLPPGPGHRSAVPQDRHVHILMARGAAEFEALFPGLLDDMVDAGVAKLENQPDSIHFGAAGHVLGTAHTLRHEFTAYVPSRKQLEWQIRRRTADLPNVEIEQRHVSAPCFDEDRRAVTGVMLSAPGRTEFVAADLVVDASGRGTRLPAWLYEWGFARPEEQTVDVGIGYATQQLRIPDGLIAEKVVVAGVSRGQQAGLGMLFYEDGTWGLTTFTVGHTATPQTFADMCTVADAALPVPLAAAIRRAEPLGDIAFHRYPVSRWRRYDKLQRFPAGIVPFGDAVASFNPTYGQGMTMTALQAGHLRRLLASGTRHLAYDLSRATAKTTYPVWTMNAIGDLTLHGTDGPAPWWYRPVGALFDQFLGAAESDPVLAEWFLRRFSLLDSLYMVPPMRIIGRTIRHNVSAWRAHRRASVPVRDPDPAPDR
ncbi:2-polyprenyl-6-methoxyphenol hydroxylase-like FAD-dependent oxidoreductase [Mycolicibacterium sp. BK634]|uniref:FAD-dependent oxidoreductase n=1 Tax=Mycolicibacterium sp. BK634 TaxID=2587099 RepID=UPI0016112CEB|nr:2-polyprenyl-6-methoxyphenol hydroxylase-like FAD-dependent oxidoreductase [Mycolicibacterium sp. BK634]